MFRRTLILSSLAALALPASPQGRPRKQVTEKITIDAPADAVWARIKDFDGLKNWHPAVAESPADKGNAVGSVRTLALKGGGQIVETLESYDGAKKRYGYRAKDGGALPVSDYTSTISVSAAGAQSVVEWHGSFYRGHPDKDPPPNLNDDAAVKAVTGVYQGGLANLKKLVEGK